MSGKKREKEEAWKTEGRKKLWVGVGKERNAENQSSSIQHETGRPLNTVANFRTVPVKYDSDIQRR